MSSNCTAETVKQLCQESQRISCVPICEGLKPESIRRVIKSIFEISLLSLPNSCICFSGVVCEELSSDGGRKTDVKILQGCILWLKYFFDGDVNKLYKSKPKLCPNIFNTGMYVLLRYITTCIIMGAWVSLQKSTV